MDNGRFGLCTERIYSFEYYVHTIGNSLLPIGNEFFNLINDNKFCDNKLHREGGGRDAKQKHPIQNNNISITQYIRQFTWAQYIEIVFRMCWFLCNCFPCVKPLSISVLLNITNIHCAVSLSKNRIENTINRNLRMGTW